MKLIFLYGLPGVGKLTVARETAKLTGLNVFYNQLAVDLVESLRLKNSGVLPFRVSRPFHGLRKSSPQRPPMNRWAIIIRRLRRLLQQSHA
jgi:hypothetical protein